MAKKVTRTKLSNIEVDKRLEQIMSQDWSHMTNLSNTNKRTSYAKTDIKDLRKEGNRLVSMLNKRIRRMEEKGELTRAYQQLVKERGTKPRFSTRGLSKERLIEEIKRMKAYERLAQSYLRGAKKEHRRTLKKLSEFGVTFTDSGEEKDFFDLFDKWKEISKDNPRLNKQKPSDVMRKLKKTYDKYVEKGVTDEKKIIDSLKRKIYAEERKKAEQEQRETEAIFGRKRK